MIFTADRALTNLDSSVVRAIWYNEVPGSDCRGIVLVALGPEEEKNANRWKYFRYNDVLHLHMNEWQSGGEHYGSWGTYYNKVIKTLYGPAVSVDPRSLSIIPAKAARSHISGESVDLAKQNEYRLTWEFNGKQMFFDVPAANDVEAVDALRGMLKSLNLKDAKVVYVECDLDV